MLRQLISPRTFSRGMTVVSFGSAPLDLPRLRPIAKDATGKVGGGAGLTSSACEAKAREPPVPNWPIGSSHVTGNYEAPSGRIDVAFHKGDIERLLLSSSKMKNSSRSIANSSRIRRSVSR